MARKKGEAGLLLIIQEDTKLSPSEKVEFLSLANLYMLNFNDNLRKGSIDLSDETEVDVATWRKFLSYPPIKRFIDSFINEKIRKRADGALLEGHGTRDAINVRKAMIDAESSEDNTRFIIMRLPERRDDIDE
jgi:hypothetical protein